MFATSPASGRFMLFDFAIILVLGESWTGTRRELDRGAAITMAYACTIPVAKLLPGTV